MNPYLSFRRLGAMFVGVFLILVGAVFVYDRFWTEPGERCEDAGQWYDISTRTCATPLYIPDITGRAPGESRAEASARGAQEIIELENRAAAQDAAIREQADAARRDYEAQQQ